MSFLSTWLHVDGFDARTHTRRHVCAHAGEHTPTTLQKKNTWDPVYQSVKLRHSLLTPSNTKCSNFSLWHNKIVQHRMFHPVPSHGIYKSFVFRNRRHIFQSNAFQFKFCFVPEAHFIPSEILTQFSVWFPADWHTSFLWQLACVYAQKKCDSLQNKWRFMSPCAKQYITLHD